MNLAAAVRVPPQNIEAEESVLGAMLVAKPTLTQVIDEVGLVAGDFYLDRHRVIFDAIAALHAESKPTDEKSVTDLLSERKIGRGSQRKKAIDEAGGKHYVSELAAKVPAAGNAAHYADIVKKHSLRRGVIAQAQLAIEAAYEGSIDGEVDSLITSLEVAKLGSPEIMTVKASDVTLRSPSFLDEAKMIPMRSVTVVFGKGGLGKTMFSINRAAAVTRGKMPGLDGPRPVLISSQEDDAEAVLAPRCVAAGADLDLIHFVSGLTLPSQVPALMARARRLGAAMIVVDPIGEHLDSAVDSHKDAAVRAALRPLATGAQELGIAVVIVCHPNKNSGASGLDRISGSGAFGNAARSVIVFGPDPGDPDGDEGDRRIVAHLKCNVGRRAMSVAAEIRTTPVTTADGEALIPHLVVTGASELSADEVLSTPNGEERTEREGAIEFLSGFLADGPMRSTEVLAQGEHLGYSKRTLERAKKELGLKAAQGGDGWYWLPQGREEL